MTRNKFLKILFIVLSAAIPGCKSDPNLLAQIPTGSRQILAVEADPKASTKARVIAWEFKDESWRQVFGPLPAIVGRNGIAPEGEKREGDGRTPSGIYSLGTAFGYGPSPDSLYPYRQATEHDFWVDDSESAQYNQWVTGQPIARSFERMKRDDDLYKYGVVIEYNTQPVIPHRGSAIFLHVWRDANNPTAGCVAVSEENLLKILKWLDPSQKPIIAIKEER